MSAKPTTTLRLKFIKEAKTSLARLYENDAGSRLWIPRSVCPSTFKYPPAPDWGQPVFHDVEIENWWIEQNPWVTEEQGRFGV